MAPLTVMITVQIPPVVKLYNPECVDAFSWYSVSRMTQSTNPQDLTHQVDRLGDYLRTKRQAAGLTSYQLAERAGVDQSSIVRIERGDIARPKFKTLTKLAKALDLNVAEDPRLSGYLTATDLPPLKPYLRTRYHELSEADIEKIEAYAAELAKRHGATLAGPTNGEDEQA